MTHTLFVSDLHLGQDRPNITRLFLDFLATRARAAEAIYILGDLFDYWAGDDDIDDLHHRPVIQAMHNLVESGTPVYVMHGNRDFLLGKGFAEATGAKLLPDPVVIDLYGRRVLLTHGDQQCTDDLAYQTFRSMVRDSHWQQGFLAQPLSQRKAQIAELRSRSEQEKSYKDSAIMDVNPNAIIELLKYHDLPPLLIHGHTHRPGRHVIEVDGRTCERIVLADWGDRGSCLECSAGGCEVRELNL